MHSKKPLTILNVGNTHVHLFDLMEDGALASRAILTTAEFAASPVKWLEKSRQFAASSVVPAVTRMLSSLGVFVVSPEMTFPFFVRKLDLSTVGADRLANAARLTEGKLPAVCIDFGLERRRYGNRSAELCGKILRVVRRYKIGRRSQSYRRGGNSVFGEYREDD